MLVVAAARAASLLFYNSLVTKNIDITINIYTMTRAKMWSKRHEKFYDKLVNAGYVVKIHWIDNQCYECIEVYSKQFNNFLGEFTTLQVAWTYFQSKNKI